MSNEEEVLGRNRGINAHTRIFYKFLKKNCILEKFLFNCKKQRLGAFNRSMQNVKKHDGNFLYFFNYDFITLSSAFSWRESVEGDKFWRDLEQKFFYFLSREKGTLRLIEEKNI